MTTVRLGPHGAGGRQAELRLSAHSAHHQGGGRRPAPPCLRRGHKLLSTTARAYSDSEEKVGAALCRHAGQNRHLHQDRAAVAAAGMWKDLEESLRTLRTDYIDIYQFHNPAFCPQARRRGRPCTRPPWRPSARGRSGTSPSPTTGWLWPTRPSTPGCTTPSSSPSATSPAPRSWSWWTSAGRRTWASSP